MFDYQPDDQRSGPGHRKRSTSRPARPTPRDITGSLDEKKEKPPKPEKPPSRKTADARSRPHRPPKRRSRRGTVYVPSRPAGVARPSARSWNGCSRGGRNSKRARGKSTFAKACSRPPRSASNRDVEELKAVESRISTATEQKGEADAARFKGIITMYEGMKPKDAAKVFDRLEMSGAVSKSPRRSRRARCPTSSA